MITAGTFDRAIGDWAEPLPHPRFSVYRNNVSAALIGALRVRFPVTEQLTGSAFFAAMAGSFAERHRPRSPVLINYGGEFPDHVAGFEPAAAVPYLADVARLEDLWWLSYHAAEATPLSVDALAAVRAEDWARARFRIHPSAAVARFNHAAVSIWHAHHGGRPFRDIATGTPEWALVSRPFAEVSIRGLSHQAHDFLAGLIAGAGLVEVLDQMLSHHPDFDQALHLSALVGLNIITGLET
ncbi:MAG: putative DNA-binding domain-containing protein [Alphaproteobacteria bacterium]|nr:putative DNA-binding domain-containing protein [Alphaproteobacteria bacterium]